MIPQNIIEEILNRVSIVDVIGKYVELKRAGKNYMGLCPFHNEKTPSFSVSDEKGLYHCFGCKASGNAVKFLMENRRMSFPESIQELAEMAGIDLSQYRGKGDSEDSGFRKRLYDIHKEAMLYYHELLMNSPGNSPVWSYLRSRKLDPELIKDFRIGYGGTDWQGLTDTLRRKGFKDQEILQASLASEGKNGLYDRFRGRLLFPILDRNAKPVGFGGRVLPGDDSQAKYLNSSETPIFRKGSLLFGLHYAKDEMIKKQACMVTEGYMDVLACYQFGIKNAVAPLGTAFAESQLMAIKRYSPEVWFLFDGDAAGLKAADRALDTALDVDIRQTVVILPSGMDPYDFLMARGKDEFVEYLRKNRMSPIDFKIKYIDSAVNAKKDKLGFLKGIFGYIKKVRSAVLRDDYLVKVSDFLVEDQAIIREEYRNFSQGNRRFGSEVEMDKSEGGMNRVELGFIAALAAFPEMVTEVARIADPLMIRNTEAAELFGQILDNPGKSTAELTAVISNPEIQDAVSEYAVRSDVKPNIALEMAYRLKVLQLKREYAETERLIEYADRSGDTEERNRLLQLQQEMNNERDEWERELARIAFEMSMEA